MARTFMYPHNAMLDEMVAQFFGDTFGKNQGSKYPLTNVYDEGGIAYMEMAVAGFSKDDIEITVENDTLTIKGVKEKEDHPNRNYIKKDIAMRNFEKSYNLMFPIEKIDAEFENGILKLTLVPVKQTDNKQKIEIKTK